MTEAEHPEPGQITSESTVLRAGITPERLSTLANDPYIRQVKT